MRDSIWWGMGSFGNGFARNVVIFGVDDRSPFHTENRKNNFLILGEGPTQGINDNITMLMKVTCM